MNILFENTRFNMATFLEYSREGLKLNEVEDWKKEVFSFFIAWHSQPETISVNTSGSTGQAKTIVIAKKHMIVSARATLKYLHVEPHELAWLCMPARYIAGKMMIVRAIVDDLDLVITKPQSTPKIPSAVTIGIAAMVPVQVYNLLHASKLNKTIIEQSIQNLIIGGSFIHQNLENELATFKMTKVWHTHGMTETLSHIALRQINTEPTESHFTPLPGVTLSNDSNNCLVIDYPKLGLNRLHTNDIVVIEPDGTFCVQGRIDYVLNIKGIKINPEEIEKKIESVLPYNCCLTSRPDEVSGELLILCIEGDHQLATSICSIWDSIVRVLQKHEIPAEITFFQPFLRNENGKIDRRDIKNKMLTFTTS